VSKLDVIRPPLAHGERAHYLKCVAWLICASALSLAGCDDEPTTSVGPDAGGGSAGGDGAGGVSTAGVSLGGAQGGTGPNLSCSQDDDCPPGTLCDEGSMSCQAGCLSDQECGQQERCLEGLCRALQSCTEGQGCEGDAVCSCDGLCLPKVGAPCTGNLQCATSEYCDPCEGQCKPRVAPCGPCQLSESCARRGDLCAPIGESAQRSCLRRCEGQATCDQVGPGYLCQAVGSEPGMFCVPESGDCASVAQCQSDAECPADHFCNERQQCQGGCLGEDTACPTGQLCQGLRCAPPCMVAGDCSATGAVCEEGRCRIPGGCTSSQDCLEAETYCDLNSNRCVSGCQVDNDCLDATQECVGGRCRPRGCSRNYQCSFGEVCDLETSQCVLAEGRHCEAGCDPQASDSSCGTGGQRCLSLQDEEENPIGDFCFEPCQEEPNPCPQGYSCTTIEDPNAGELKLCVRRCDVEPIGG